MSQDRALTQQIATHVHQLGYDEIYYSSRHGYDLSNWAVFEPFAPQSVTIRELDLNDPDLHDALAHLDLRLDRGL